MWKIAEVFEGSIFPARLWSKKEGKQVTAHASSGCSRQKEKHKITKMTKQFGEREFWKLSGYITFS